jgi:hypothetical protein
VLAAVAHRNDAGPDRQVPLIYRTEVPDKT